jgi:hypothetical protein
MKEKSSSGMLWACSFLFNSILAFSLGGLLLCWEPSCEEQTYDDDDDDDAAD